MSVRNGSAVAAMLAWGATVVLAAVFLWLLGSHAATRDAWQRCMDTGRSFEDCERWVEVTR